MHQRDFGPSAGSRSTATTECHLQSDRSAQCPKLGQLLLKMGGEICEVAMRLNRQNPPAPEDTCQSWNPSSPSIESTGNLNFPDPFTY